MPIEHDVPASADDATPTPAPNADPIEARVQSVDAFLGRWRHETVERRAVYDEAAALAETERRRRLRHHLVGAGVSSAALALCAAVWAVSQLPREALADAGPAAAAVVVAELPDPDPAPTVTVDEPTPAPPPTPPVEGIPADLAEIPEIPEGSVRGARTWVRGGYVWTEFTVPTPSDLRIAWFDAAGAEVLERMGCGSADGAERRCTAGRTATRIGHAIAAGAEPGEWTVRACDAEACAVVGSFTAPW